jgi:hypothetical protein
MTGTDFGKMLSRYKCYREAEIDKRRAEGIPLDLTYKELDKYFDPFWKNYVCNDGLDLQ